MARNLWVPAVDNQGTFGRGQFIEIDDPWDARRRIRERTNGRKAVSK